MASLHNYKFDNLTRIGDDVCALSEEIFKIIVLVLTQQKTILKKCGMKQPIDFATQQPNVFYRVVMVLWVLVDAM